MGIVEEWQATIKRIEILEEKIRKIELRIKEIDKKRAVLINEKSS